MTRNGTGRLRGVGILLPALLLAVGMLSATSTANAAESTGSDAVSSSAAEAPVARTAARRVNYGAIAFNPSTGWSGWSYDKATKRKAKKAAVRHCKSRTPSNVSASGCKPTVWVRNGCAAVAVRVKDNQIVKYRWGVAFTERRAKKEAKRKVGRNAKVHTWVCTTRYR